jgi:hypothetical protein
MHGWMDSNDVRTCQNIGFGAASWLLRHVAWTAYWITQGLLISYTFAANV